MKYGSLFSGIEAASVAWKPLGWHCAWVAEIDPFACAVLAHHYPDVPNLGDVSRIDADAIEPVDLIVFGSPCQSFSVAGKRFGLDDPRGNMALVGLGVVGQVRPLWVVFENVPGLLSSDGGRDFGAFLGLLGELGYGFAYRVLDAQHFGVPQRRRRVFVVGHLGDWRPAAAVLFEPESLRGDPAPRRETGQNATAGAGDGSAFSIRPNHHDAAWRGDGADNLIGFQSKASPSNSMNPGPVLPALDVGKSDGLCIAFGGNRQSGAIDVATAVNAHGGPHGRLDFESETFVTHSLRADGFDASEDGTGRGTPLTVALRGREGGGAAELGDDVALALRASQGGGDKPHALVSGPLRSHVRNNSNPATEAAMHIQDGMSVRRLLPVECERLQGLPDNYTLVPYRGKPAADGPRYRAIGNSFAAPVVRWIGHRIQLFEDATRSLGKGSAAA